MHACGCAGLLHMALPFASLDYIRVSQLLEE